MIRPRYLVGLAVAAIIAVPRARHYFFGQLLRASDFEQEQDYHRRKPGDPSPSSDADDPDDS